MARKGKKGRGGRPPLHEPRWLISGGIAAVATALICWPAWPGYMSYDSLLAWSQAIGGIHTSLWPPLHAYLFRLSRAAHAGAWGLFVAQTFILLFSANLALNLWSRRTWLGLALSLAFLASFVWIAPQLGVLQTQWRDVTTTSFAVLGLALWLLAAKYEQIAVIVGAAAAFGASLALRYNAPALIGFLLILMVWRPFLGASPSRGMRLVAAAAVAVSLALAWASIEWRLPDLKRLPSGNNAMVTQQFDLIGISACSGIDYLPPEMTAGSRVSGEAIAKAYDARHLNLSLGGKADAPKLIKLPPTDEDSRIVGRAWRRALVAQPRCYLWHRRAVMTEQLGLVKDHVFYPTHGGIDPNPYGLKLAHPKASAWLTARILNGSTPMWRRAFWLYLVAGALTLAATWWRREQATLVAAILGGAYGYVALLFLAGPAADARYIFPSNVFCVLAILLSFAALLPRRLAG